MMNWVIVRCGAERWRGRETDQGFVRNGNGVIRVLQSVKAGLQLADLFILCGLLGATFR